MNRASSGFYGVFKYCSASTAAQILQNGTMRWRSPLEYNDPFDAQWDPLWTLRTPEFEAEYLRFGRIVFAGPINWSDVHDDAVDDIRRFRRRFAPMPEAKRQTEVDRQLRECLPMFKRRGEEQRPFLNAIARLRVLCFSRSPASVLMWSHYANEHRGAVVGFDADVLKEAFGVPLLPVIYESSLPVLIQPELAARQILIGARALPIEPGDTQRIITTKFSEWSYEQELRFKHPQRWDAEPHEVYLPFPREAVRYVWTGVKCTPADEAAIREAVRGYPNSVQVIRVKRDLVRFGLEGFQLQPGPPPSLEVPRT